MKNAHSRTFSERLSAAMAARGLTKLALSELLDVSHTTVGRWLLADGFEPRASTAQRLAEVLGINAQWLLDGEGPMAGTGSPTGEEPARYQARQAPRDGPNLAGLPTVPLRWIPVISWTHAGQAASYEELPLHWQEKIPATCRDENAFALIVEGDSMEPRCMAGDIVVLVPDEEPRNGCLVVVKFRDDGVALRRFTRLPDGGIRLIAYNPLYPALDYQPEDFHWIYPVHSTVRRELH